ncbi:putative ATPase [Streptomyces olivoverticillatus]|uniref:Putative ATPase n=1 Tax=Streptomyces olivoverticillatus TaxID=66427 RepID=A0A7W7LKS9_9ACTN|nr:BTAD domain-containing putative transcriptional regulator [Streptomyces olivoverticillatus]MBB4892035.1 putative ATPase [Streptomyces olivoverticillatus]
MRFGVLGPLMVWGEAGEQVRVPEAKVRALLAHLVAHAGRPVSADRLVEELWAGRPPGKPAGALQAKVSQLRRAIGRDRVVHQPPGYRLRVADGEVDADRFRTLVARARAAHGPRERTALLTEALGLWRGPAFDGFDASNGGELVHTAALHLEELRLGALEEQAEARLELGEHDPLAAELTALVARHPLRERLRAAQLRALYRAGRQSEALASYAELREKLAEELGLDPGPELAALHRAILTQAPELAAPAAPAPARTAHLPAPLTELVGRQQAVKAVGELLAAHRLVTLTGPGGVGKTALAIEAAGRCERPDGVWFAELAGQGVAGSAGGSVTEIVAGVLGVPDERLPESLRDREALLVLDNCEHAVEPVAELVGRLLRTAPGMRVLATSQEPLGLPGETLHAVEPLPTEEAVRLFAARAAAASPGFVLDASNRAAVEDVCRRLDGLPLALELAATRVRALGVHELAARLDDRFRVLAGHRRGAPPRQQTLRAVIDWSWELLTEAERVVLRRLAVHTDGCTLGAAEAVCGEGAVARDEVLGVLARLVDRSLVVMADGPHGPRYRLLESVAAYAAERLREAEGGEAEGGEADAVRMRHLRHYTAFAERAQPGLQGHGQQRWLSLLDADTGNLRAALDAAVRYGAAQEASRLVSALSCYWLLRGRFGEGRRAAEAALGLGAEAVEVRSLRDSFVLLTGERTDAGAPGRQPGPESDRARWIRAYALFNTGHLAASELLNGRALEGFRAGGDRWGIAAVHGLRAMHALIRGDLTAISRDGTRSIALFRELGDSWGQLQSVAPLASLAEAYGEYDRAEELLRDGTAMAEALGLATELSALLSRQGRIALLTGDTSRARALHERARKLAAEQGYKFGEIHAELGLALGARREGDLDTAEAVLHRIRAWYAEVSTEAGNALVLAELGFTAELRGDAETARAHHLDALAAARPLGDPRAVALPLEGLAGAELLAGDAERAARLLGTAAAARASVGVPLPPPERGDVDRITAGAKRVLGDARFAEAFEAGYAARQRTGVTPAAARPAVMCESPCRWVSPSAE